MAFSFFSSFFSALTFQIVFDSSLQNCIFACKIDKAKEILKVKEDVDVLMSQCETYLKEKEEAMQATKNLEESYGQKISELQEELHLKDKQLESCQDQITKDKDNLKNAQLEAEKLNKEFQQRDASVLGNVNLTCLLLSF